MTYAYEIADYFRPLKGDLSEWTFGAAPTEMKQYFDRFRIPRFTKTLSQWINLIVDSGFMIERAEEPRPTDEMVEQCPYIQDAQVVAYFLHIRVRKSAD